MANGQGGYMRVIVELHHTDDEGVHGAVIADDHSTNEPRMFTGWLELLRLLEILAPPASER
jgi:hypothetical protein